MKPSPLAAALSEEIWEDVHDTPSPRNPSTATEVELEGVRAEGADYAVDERSTLLHSDSESDAETPPADFVTAQADISKADDSRALYAYPALSSINIPCPTHNNTNMKHTTLLFSCTIFSNA